MSLPLASSGTDPLGDVLAEVSVRPAATISHHGRRCCREARAWFLALARARSTTGGAAPSWIARKWRWSPIDWPVFWCRLAESDRADCGLLAALGRHAYLAGGLRAHAVQLIERFDERAGRNWEAAWRGRSNCHRWIFGDLVYHEAVGVVLDEGTGRGIRVWDPTDDCWIEGKPRQGYGAVVAIRCWPGAIEHAGVSWNGRDLPLDRWIRLDGASGSHRLDKKTAPPRSGGAAIPRSVGGTQGAAPITT